MNPLHFKWVLKDKLIQVTYLTPYLTVGWVWKELKNPELFLGDLFLYSGRDKGIQESFQVY